MIISRKRYERDIERARYEQDRENDRIKREEYRNVESNDMIDKQLVIDIIEQHREIILGEREWQEGIAYGYAMAHRHLADIFKQLPSAQPEDKCCECDAWNQYKNYPRPQWIPCSERLPEDLEEVNVTWVNHIPEQYYDAIKDKHFTGSAVYYKGSWYWYSSTCVDILAEYGRNEIDKIDDGIEVVAYMPLPEPWKEETAEKGREGRVMGDLVRIEEKQIIEAIANRYNIGTDGVSIYSDYEFIRRGDDKVRRDFVYAIIDKRAKPSADPEPYGVERQLSLTEEDEG